MSYRSDENGTTMIETIMYISMLIFLGGTLAKYVSNTFNRYRVGRAAQQVIDLKKAIVHFTAASEDYTDLTEEAMDKQRAIPIDMRTAGQTARHALGGSALFGPVTELLGAENSDNKYMFYITFNDLQQDACTEILTQGQFYGDGSEMDTLIVNNTSAWRYRYSLYDTTGLLSVHTLSSGGTGASAATIHLGIDEAVSACSNKKNNTITWIFS